MKKQFIIAISLTMTNLFFTSCESKEKDKQITPSNSTQAASYAIFSTIEEYESLFDDANTADEKADKIAARFGTYNEKARLSTWGEQDTLYPRFLQKILNDDHIIQIEQWLLKLDMGTKRVIVLDIKHKDQYHDLAKANTNNTNILVYSTEDEVLPLLREGITSQTSRTSGIFCKGRESKSLNNQFQSFGTTINGNPIGLNSSLRYVNAGFYFTLYYHIESIEKKPTNNTYIPRSVLAVGWDATYVVNCNNGNFTKGEVNTGPDPSIVIEKNCYLGTKSLSKYTFSMRGITMINNQYTETPTYTITDGY